MHVSPMFWPLVRILPLEFTEQMTDYEYLMHVCKKMRELIKSNNDLQEVAEELLKNVEELQDTVDKIQNGDYEWLRKIIEKAIHNVYFGLTEDGNFVAYIPDSWSSIKFKTTGYDTTVDCAPGYGHLVIEY